VVLSFQTLFGIFFRLIRIHAIVHDRSSAIGAASVTARLEISRLASTHAKPLRSTAGWFPCGAFQAAMPKRCRIPGAGPRWRAGPSPSRKFDRESGFADEPLPARPKARRQSWSRAALGECGAGKAMRNFPAYKPLKYHKTAKYSCVGAAMKTPPAESPR
jgi:hypothetical protein